MMLRNILIAIIIILLVLLGFVTISKNDLEVQKKEINAEMLKVNGELDRIKLEIDEKIKTIEQLGGEVGDLKLLRNELMKEKEDLLKDGLEKSKQLVRLQSKIQGYTRLLKNKDDEVARLKDTNKVLHGENVDLKVEKKGLLSANDSLKRQNDNMVKQVDLASRLTIENVKFIAVNKRGKEREGNVLKTKHILTLKVTFNIAENNIAPIQGNTIYFRILNPQNKPMFDLNNGGGTFNLEDGVEYIYTAKKNILFDNSKQLLVFSYAQKERFPKGNYTIEAYANNYLMGTGKLLVQ